MGGRLLQCEGVDLDRLGFYGELSEVDCKCDPANAEGLVNLQ
jgi:hypothetical protein